jgi:lipopolysaccharide/colanic/teichoic acid biosynthesis glycosyltransferase
MSREMSALVARLMSVRQELAIELKRFVLLWQYQHPVPPFTLWWRLVVKRVLDLLGSLVGLTLAGLAMIAIAVAIKVTSKGPIIYAQQRVGRFGQTFKIYKFRSMRVDAEKSGPVWASKRDDPRLTPIGGFLRRTHLDELPQLFNVFKGEMSLVGPRPERPCFVEELDQAIPRYDERHLIKPGMTGLAQVHYCYDQSLADVKRKLRYDLLYVKRMCLTLDLRILASTLVTISSGRGK